MGERRGRSLLIRELLGRLTWAAAGGAVVSALFLWGWVGPWLNGLDPSSTLTRGSTEPYVARPARIVTRWQEKVVVREVRVLVPPSDAAQGRVERRFDLKLGGGVDLISVVTLKPLPWGGEAATVLHPDGGAETVVKPKARPLFQLAGLREFGAGADVLDLGASFAAWYRQDLLRLGPVVAGLEVRGEWERDVGGSGRVLGTVVVRP